MQPALNGRLYVVPGWLIGDKPPQFYVSLPLDYSSLVGSGGNFASHCPAVSTLEEAERIRDQVIAAGLPLHGIITVSVHGGRVVWRNEDEVTAELIPRQDFGTW